MSKSVAQEHANICESIKELYARKNADYGNSFASARKEVPFYTLGKLYDKFSRYKDLTLNGESAAQVDESLDDTLLDMANYIYNKHEVRFIRGRLKFGDSKNSAPFPSMVVVFRGG